LTFLLYLYYFLKNQQQSVIYKRSIKMADYVATQPINFSADYGAHFRWILPFTTQFYSVIPTIDSTTYSSGLVIEVDLGSGSVGKVLLAGNFTTDESGAVTGGVVNAYGFFTAPSGTRNTNGAFT